VTPIAAPLTSFFCFLVSDTTSEQSEVINMRDSIIAPNNKSDPNRLPDWSFMDEATLASVAKHPGAVNRYF
jgi:hypothetical protein